MFGLKTTTMISAIFEISTSVCPAPTLSIIIGLNPAYSKTRILLRNERETAPVAPLDAILRIYVPESVDSLILTLSPKIAPPVTWLVGSTANTAGFVPNFFIAIAVLLIKELLPAPAGPVIPIIIEFPLDLKIFFNNFFDSV